MGFMPDIYDEAVRYRKACAEANRKANRLQAEVERLKEALGIDDCIFNFAKRMQYKLDKNKHKECSTMNPDGKGRGWSHCSLFWLRKRIKDETIELFRALQRGQPEDIKNECADVANFSMMIYNIVSKEQALKG